MAECLCRTEQTTIRNKKGGEQNGLHKKQQYKARMPGFFFFFHKQWKAMNSTLIKRAIL